MKFNLELFLARKIFFHKNKDNHFSRSILSFAIFGISLGIAVMILSVAIISGFKSEVRNKVIGFSSHIQLIKYSANTSYETDPILYDSPWYKELDNIDNIKFVQPYATKPGIVKTDSLIEGIVLKGVNNNYNWEFIKKNLIEGEIPDFSSQELSKNILVSKATCNLLDLSVGDFVYMYFLNEGEKTPRMRRFKITGVYSTSLEEFDKIFAFVDLRQVQKINGWNPNQIGGIEIDVNNFDLLDKTISDIKDKTINYSKEGLPPVRVVDVRWKYSYIFDWLNLLDMNVWVIIFLIVLVAGFNMVSGLLILILERTHMIGVLKSVGSSNVSIQKIFIILSSFLITKGLLIGNILALTICFIQKEFGIFHLDPVNYYVNTVPIELNISHILLLNICTLLVTIFMLIVPSLFVAKISPQKAIHFD